MLALLSSFLVLSLTGGINARADGPAYQVQKDSDGQTLLLNQYDAVAKCASLGQHLATARDLAVISQSLGSEGIAEESWVMTLGAGSPPNATYVELDTRNFDATAGLVFSDTDSFYFSNRGYHGKSTLGTHLYWSNSVFHSDNSIMNGDESDEIACLDGGDGSVSLGHERADYRLYHRNRTVGFNPSDLQSNAAICIAN